MGDRPTVTGTIGSIIISNDPVIGYEDFLLNISPMDTPGYAEAKFHNYTPIVRAEGGYWAATFTVHARENILKELYENALGRRVEVWGYGLEPNFEGRIEELVFVLPPDRFTKNLRGLSNKAHMRADVDGDGEVDRTSVIENEESQNLYGIAEGVMSGGQLSGVAVADQAIQSHVNLRALPKPAVSLGGEGCGGIATIEIFVRGYITTLEQRLYNQTDDVGNQSLSSEITDIIELVYDDVQPASLLVGLESWWALDESSDGTGAVVRVDSHGTNDLTDNGTTPSTTGKVNLATQHTNAVPDWLSHVSNASLQAGDIDFAFACWVYLDNKTTSQFFVSKDDTIPVGDREYAIQYQLGTNRFRFVVFTAVDVGEFSDANTLGSPAVATWYLIIGWHDSVANTVNIQVNNGAVDSVATSGPLQAAGAAEFQIGARDNLGSRALLDGRVDEVGFWKRILTVAERTALYNAGAGVYYPDIGKQYLVSGVGEFIESIEVDANTTSVTKEYDVDRKASSIVFDLPRLGDSSNNRWLLYCYGRDCTTARGRRAYLRQAAPVQPPG